MRFLFVHNNAPAQFKHIANTLAHEGHEVVFMAQFFKEEVLHPAIKTISVAHNIKATLPQKTYFFHPEAIKTFYYGEFFGSRMVELARTGWKPDAIFSHPFLGVGIHIPDVFPESVYINYGEWFFKKEIYAEITGDSGDNPLHFANSRYKNLYLRDALLEADVVITPTQWQKEQHPAVFHDKIHVIHDGIDMDYFKPEETNTEKHVVQGLNLSDLPEIVTFATRSLEPVRGFPEFFRSIPAILQQRPEAHVVIMGKTEISYGDKRQDNRTWRDVMLEEIRVDADRVHFLDFGSYDEYRKVLRASSVHVYLTKPFILSWSLLESMSCGCLVVSSATPPVQEVITHGHNGFLVPFADSDALARQIIECLAHQQDYAAVRAQARETIARRYDIRKVLPLHFALLTKLLQEKQKELAG